MYSDLEKEAIYRVIAERRDMRHFIKKSVAPDTLNKIFNAANQAPSVGLMQPWRFIRITEDTLRQKIHKLVDKERVLTAKALNKCEDEFMKLKVEGILECGELIVVALPNDREQHIFGRRTMPQMDLASTACAIQNMWLVARAEEIGMGWVSIFEPKELSSLLNMPEGSEPVAILCIGHVEKFYDEPMLISENWTSKTEIENLVFENSWDSSNITAAKLETETEIND